MKTDLLKIKPEDLTLQEKEQLAKLFNYVNQPDALAASTDNNGIKNIDKLYPMPNKNAMAADITIDTNYNTLLDMAYSGFSLTNTHIYDGDFTNKSYYGVNLDFTKTLLKNCNFSYADLSGVIFNDSTLIDCIFESILGINMVINNTLFSNISTANISYSDFSNSTFQNLTAVVLSNVNLQNTIITGDITQGDDVSVSRYDHCNFNYAKFNNTYICDTFFYNCDFYKSQFKYAQFMVNFGYVSFNTCNFTDADLSNILGERTTFVDCNFSNTNVDNFKIVPTIDGEVDLSIQGAIRTFGNSNINIVFKNVYKKNYPTVYWPTGVIYKWNGIEWVNIGNWES